VSERLLTAAELADIASTSSTGNRRYGRRVCVEYRGVYACRHTFAAWSIAAGVQPFHLSRIMGTSVSQIDATYGHLVPDSEEYLRGLLDSYDRVDRSEAATNL
jgi:hypothetical protein